MFGACLISLLHITQMFRQRQLYRLFIDWFILPLSDKLLMTYHQNISNDGQVSDCCCFLYFFNVTLFVLCEHENASELSCFNTLRSYKSTTRAACDAFALYELPYSLIVPTDTQYWQSQTR